MGLYIAHESEVKGLGRIGERILSKFGGGAFGVVLNNERLGAGEGAFDVRLCFSFSHSCFSFVSCRVYEQESRS